MPQKTARRAPVRRSSPSSQEADRQEEAHQARPDAHPADPLAVGAGRAGHRAGGLRSARDPLGLVRRGRARRTRDLVAPPRRRSVWAPWRSRWSASTGGSSCSATSRVEDRVRMFIGFLVLAFGVLGLISLFRDNPGVFEPHARPRARGGAGRARSLPTRCRACSRRSARDRVPRARRARAADLHRHAGLAHHRVDPRVPRLAPGARPGGGRWRRRQRSAPQAAPSRDGSRSARRSASTCPRTRWSSCPSRPRHRTSALDDGGASPSPPRPGRRRHGRSPPRAARTSCRRSTCCASAPPSTADGRDEQDTMAALERTLQTFGVDARVTGCSPRSDRHDVRGRHRRRHQGEQGPAARRATSPTRSPRPTCGSSRRSPASPRSASRCRTSTATS